MEQRAEKGSLCPFPAYPLELALDLQPRTGVLVLAASSASAQASTQSHLRLALASCRQVAGATTQPPPSRSHKTVLLDESPFGYTSYYCSVSLENTG